jgi:HEAT repeat protein
MNELLKKMSGGDLRSDGRANEVAEEVIKNPDLFNKLVEGCYETDDVIRARTAHALERISRTNQEIIQEFIAQYIKLATKDEVPMVKWHLAMILGNMTFPQKELDVIISTLIHLLEDDSVFVKSWSIVSLSLIGRKNKEFCKQIIDKMKSLQDDESIAVRTKASKAVDILKNENKPIPDGWSKTLKQKNVE